MALEQALNGDGKCGRILVGIININANARNRWNLTSHMRANVTDELCCMAKLKTSDLWALVQHIDNNYDQSTRRPKTLYECMNLNAFNPFRKKKSSTVEQPMTGKRSEVNQNEKFLCNRNWQTEVSNVRTKSFI